MTWLGGVRGLPAESPKWPQASKHGSGEDFRNMNYLKDLEDEISAWPHISVHGHRFGGREFRFGSAELGHIHNGGIVDIPFPRSLRDALLAEGLAEEHHWVPNSGWITFHVRNGDDFQHAVWLMRLSYLRYALKTAPNPQSSRTAHPAKGRAASEPPVQFASRAFFSSKREPCSGRAVRYVARSLPLELFRKGTHHESSVPWQEWTASLGPRAGLYGHV